VENSKELKNDMNYTIAINPLACTGCENCANNCPKKCFSFVKYYDKNIEYAQLFNKLEEKNLNHTIDTNNVTFNKLQYLQPYFRYHSACAGCSGANYIKILTQLFNKTLIIANATGCSSIYSASYPYNPFFKDKQNLGPS
jgi:pyruvate-ferredoxin/flavodoxin oxidoreductase